MSIYPEFDDGDDSLLLNAQLSEELSESDLSFFDGPEGSVQGDNLGGPEGSDLDNNLKNLGLPAEATETLTTMSSPAFIPTAPLRVFITSLVHSASFHAFIKPYDCKFRRCDEDMGLENAAFKLSNPTDLNPSLTLATGEAILRLTGGGPQEDATVNGAADNASEPVQSLFIDPALEAAPAMGESSGSFGAMDPALPLVFDTSAAPMATPTSAAAMTAPVSVQARPPVYPSRAPNGTDVPMPDKKMGRVADIADPPCCPLCFHMYISAIGVKHHLRQFHNKTNAEINANPDFQHPKTLGYFKSQGIDTTYTGTVRKQVNARRRWEEGLTSDTQAYFNDIYKNTPAVRTARNRSAKKNANNA